MIKNILFTKEEYETAAQKAVLLVYLDFRRKYSIEESKEKTIKNIIKAIPVSEKFVQAAISQMWN